MFEIKEKHSKVTKLLISRQKTRSTSQIPEKSINGWIIVTILIISFLSMCSKKKGKRGGARTPTTGTSSAMSNTEETKKKRAKNACEFPAADTAGLPQRVPSNPVIAPQKLDEGSPAPAHAPLGNCLAKVEPQQPSDGGEIWTRREEESTKKARKTANSGSKSSTKKKMTIKSGRHTSEGSKRRVAPRNGSNRNSKSNRGVQPPPVNERPKHPGVEIPIEPTEDNKTQYQINTFADANDF